MDCVPHCVSRRIGDRNCVALSDTAEGRCVMIAKIYLTKGKNFFGTIRYRLVFKEQLWFGRLSSNNTFTKDELDYYAKGRSELLNDFEYVYTDISYNAKPIDGMKQVVNLMEKIERKVRDA